MFVLIDNYDSFTYNLVHFLGEEGAEMRVFRNDKITPADVLALNPEGIVLSPGPCDPDKAGICLDLIGAATGQVPIFGVCLGHQSMGQHFGGTVVRAPHVMHGKTDSITHNGAGIFKGVPSPFTATRYHSLTIARENFPDDVLEITAETSDGVIQGVRHREHPIFGVQFHPESIASEHGHQILRNFINICRNGEDKKAA